LALRGLLPLLADRPELRRLREALASGSAVPVIAGVTEAAKPYLVAALAAGLGRPALYVVRDADATEPAAEALRGLLGRDARVFTYHDRDALPYERLLPDPVEVQGRMAALTALVRPESSVVVVCSARALSQPVIPPEEFATALQVIRPSQQIEPHALLERLAALGYEPVAEVAAPGEVSHRGGIVDVFPPALPRPVRLEFWGDEIDSVRTFDPETQRSLNPVDSVLVGPAREALALRGPAAVAARLDRLDIIGMNQDARARWDRDLEALRARASFDDIAFYLRYLHDPASLLDYVPDDGLLVLHDRDGLEQTVRELATQGEEVRDRLERDGENPPGLAPAFLPWEALAPAVAAHRLLRFAGLAADEAVDLDHPGSALAPDLLAATSYGGRVRAFAQDVRKALGARQRVVVVSSQARRLAEVFADESLLGKAGTVHVAPLTDLPDLPEPGTLALVHGRFPEGWHSRSLALSVYTDAEVFGWARRKGDQRRASANPAAFLAELRSGDFVVHQDHGIGRFEGLVRLTTEGTEREYLHIAYAGTDRLYLPTDQLDRITRYVGMGDAAPALSKLGGGEWARAKQRAKESVRDIAAELLRLYSVREMAEGHPYPSDDEQPWLVELEEGFPYEETPDQERAIAEVKADMERARPMDRLVCGDVGYGKTEVALRAGFKAVLDQKQVAVLVPTTVLALQHFNTFSQRLKPYPVRVELLSRFRSEKEQKEVLTDLALGRVDIVIGTHRLLQKDVVFNDLGLIVVDEEQRFGVAHKERLKQLRTEVDVLTLTATPIPRTLHMALVNVRDMSVIETPPHERLPIRTYIRETDDALVREAILREIDRGGQIFYVHNRVQGIQAIAHRLEKLVPEAKFVVAHGQMPEDQLERVMLDFSAGEYDVLISTTIIENGLDIPNANTIIVNNASHFGLAQLYQLRGRVGRASHQAYAYFLYNKDTRLTPVQEKRLRAIFEATELGAGFRIAMKDLEIRGAGNLLGAEQSGYMNAVGFDLYTRLLEETVRELSGVRAARMPVAPVTVEIPVDAYIPDEYIADRPMKIHFYQRLANLEEPEQVEALVAELTDRFGPLPEPMANLLAIVRLKTQAARLGYEGIALREGEIILKVRRTVAIDRVGLFKRYRHDVRVQLGEARVPRRLLPGEAQAALAGLYDLLFIVVGAQPPEAASPDGGHGAPAADAPPAGANGALPSGGSSSRALSSGPGETGGANGAPGGGAGANGARPGAGGARGGAKDATQPPKRPVVVRHYGPPTPRR
jgi:transcription-repair coupling factor (superfamily II helicase)